MVIVFIKAMQVVRGAWALLASGGRYRPGWVLRHTARCNGDGEVLTYALRTVDDLRQLNQFYFYAPAQDSVQGTGVFGEIAIGCVRQRREGFAGRGRQFVVTGSGRSNAKEQRR
jgi:hypothetical protein